MSKAKVLGRFGVRANAEPIGARVEVIEQAGERRVKLIGFDGEFTSLAALSDLRTALDEANGFCAALDGEAPKGARALRGLAA